MRTILTASERAWAADVLALAFLVLICVALYVAGGLSE
jgi:hypothetical protein